MNAKMKATYKILAVSIIGILSTNCSSSSGGGSIAASDINATSAGELSKMDVNKYPLNKLVCDPMGDPDPQPNSSAGIKAELFWLTPDQPRYNQVGQIIDNGVKSDKHLFFSQLNIPRRNFSKGFPLESGGIIKNDQGQDLLEYFALRMSTVVHLAPDQEEGLYEFSVISDDGLIIRQRNDEGVYEEILNNDGRHPTKMGCSTHYVQLNRDTEKMWQIDYHQGPQYSIALTVLMRKVRTNPDGSVQVDARCGQEGENAWFNANSEPQARYKEILTRGWQVLTAKNYSLPQEAQFNPCMEGQVPVITNFHVVERADSSVWLEWTTDIPATSQVLYRVANSNDLKISISDNVLRTTRHTAIIEGLQPGKLYEFHAVAISETYGKAISSPILVDLAF